MQQMKLMGLADPAWMEVLRAEAEKPGRTKAAIAKELGVSRTAISLLCAGKYSARTDKVQAKIAGPVMALYARRVWCPHLRTAITPEACGEFCAVPMSTSDPGKLKHWAACRNCKQNPENSSAASPASPSLQVSTI
ncbi:helix-turn-helix domain-containing protein [Agrobacterium vitis]|uniref:helix-turn-helix domain-containing protein n=1 Tax=Agrobacterium vitis TaxID=373 RepID=UPI001F3E921F|nr:helix-turn-helix transcriptional regulator [Agrobacterium vitis]